VDDDTGMSLAVSGDRVADIRPMGRLQTVQVEVEPDVGGQEEEVQPDEEEEVQPEEEVKEKEEVKREDESVGEEAVAAHGEIEGASEETEAAGGETKTAEDEAELTEDAAKLDEGQEPPIDKHNPPESTKEPELSRVSATPTSPASSTTPSAASLPFPSQPSPSSRRIPRGGVSFLPNSTVAEGLDEAARRVSSSSMKRKVSKSKPLSGKDLMPLHQDVGRNNRQLAEPTTPNFKPTPEWVCLHDSKI